MRLNFHAKGHTAGYTRVANIQGNTRYLYHVCHRTTS